MTIIDGTLAAFGLIMAFGAVSIFGMLIFRAVMAVYDFLSDL